MRRKGGHCSRLCADSRFGDSLGFAWFCTLESGRLISDAPCSRCVSTLEPFRLKLVQKELTASFDSSKSFETSDVGETRGAAKKVGIVGRRDSLGKYRVFEGQGRLL